MLRKAMFILTLSLMPAGLTGCWDMSPIDETTIVDALAIDKEDEEVKITLKILKVTSQESGSSNGQGSIQDSLILSETGPTVFEALRNITEKSGREIYFQHNRLMIISEETAKEGIFPYLGFFMRRFDNRPNVDILISKGPARDVLQAKPMQEMLLSDDIAKTHKHRYILTAKSIKMTFHDAIVLLSEKTTPLLLPIIQFDKEKKKIKLKGTAVFKKDKMIATLDDIETQGYVFIQNLVQEGLVTAEIEGFPDSKVTYVIRQVKSKVTPEVKGRGLMFQVKVRADASIGEVNSSLPIEQLMRGRKLEQALEKEIVRILTKSIEKSQKKLKYDYPGFGAILSRKKPREWHRIQDSWGEMYPGIEIAASADVNIRRSGSLINSLSTLREGE